MTDYKNPVAAIREKARDFEARSKAYRLQAKELEVRASELFDCFISMDMLADKIEAALSPQQPAAGEEG